MSKIQEHHTEDVAEDPKGAHASENLALLYQSLLIGIARIRAGRQHISDGATFRRRTKAALQEVERFAIASGYDGADIRETHFAVVAFLDAVVLRCADPVREEWQRQTMQEELFGQADAGVVFFQKLDNLRTRRDSRQLADILEVFLLCLLLGFEGRYAGGMRAGLDGIIEQLRARIEEVRGRKRHLSPAWALPEEPVPAPAVKDLRERWFPAVTLVAVAITILYFVVLKLNLHWAGEALRERLS
jgi:type VI secretion system protein ImpK